MPGTFKLYLNIFVLNVLSHPTLPLEKIVETMNLKGLHIFQGHRSPQELDKREQPFSKEENYS